ncbi:MAG: ferritin family protein, partial [Desulfobacterota bacterium]|nr:ferritin family protein [Thermodesulfobacteriota bacterium]
MSIFFNPDEVLEIAEQIERNGARFYETAARKSKDEEAKKLLYELARMEEVHEKTFSQMRKQLTREEIDFSADVQTSAYLKAWADGQVFDRKLDPVNLIKPDSNLKEILKVAIGLEKESIVFYSGLKTGVNNQKYRDRIEEIIREEMNHIVLLNSKL